ncbi:surface protease GP63, partial [Trypanosoma conorhini]
MLSAKEEGNLLLASIDCLFPFNAACSAPCVRRTGVNAWRRRRQNPSCRGAAGMCGFASSSSPSSHSPLADKRCAATIAVVLRQTQAHTRFSRAMHRRLRAAPFLPLLLLLLAMHCAGVCRAAAGRRVFDDTMPRRGRPAAAVVREVPRRGQGAAQAYTVATAAAAEGTSSEGWAPIRIEVSTKDLEEKTQKLGMKRYCAADGVQCMNYLGHEVTCKADHVLTEQKKQLYTTKIIPGAVKLHAERLLVQPVAEKIELPRNLDVACQH